VPIICVMQNRYANRPYYMYVICVFYNFSPECVYVVMILASAKQSSIRIMNEYSELC
jgi:hypothetical protein